MKQEDTPFRIWITVPTRYLRGDKRKTFMEDRLLPDIKELRKQMVELGESPHINFFDPVQDNWGVHYKQQIDDADLLLFYHWKGECWFGRGARDIYDDYYHLKPQYIMYRTVHGGGLRYYIPHIKEVCEIDYHKQMKMSFGMYHPPEKIIERINNSEDDIDLVDTDELASEFPTRVISSRRWKYIYKSIF